jgi:alpha-mannosidase
MAAPGTDGDRLPVYYTFGNPMHWVDMEPLWGYRALPDSVCDMPARGIQQWLELLPSPDWMCRSELMLPPLRTLLSLTTCQVHFATLSEFLEDGRGYAVPRRYTLDDVSHGVSLGKNGDELRHASQAGERLLLAAESLAAVARLCGRPYASWDVYPLWKLEESWRQLMSAQHHDNDECEALCGHVGRLQYRQSLGLAGHVAERTLALLAERTSGPADRTVAYNPLGWTRPVAWQEPGSVKTCLIEDLPALGCRVLSPADCATIQPPELDEGPDDVTLRRGALSVTVSRSRGVITQITGPGFPAGCLRPDLPLGELAMVRAGRLEHFEQAEVGVAGDGADMAIEITRGGTESGRIHARTILWIARTWGCD